MTKEQSLVLLSEDDSLWQILEKRSSDYGLLKIPTVSSSGKPGADFTQPGRLCSRVLAAIREYISELQIAAN